MGWNKQSGDAWVLQRTVVTFGVQRSAKALELRVTGLLMIEDAQKLCGALAAEVQAAAKSEATRLFIRDALGVELQQWQERVLDQALQQSGYDAVGRLLCRKCGGVIGNDQYRFGSPQSHWEHMEGECPVPPANLEDDDGCPND